MRSSFLFFQLFLINISSASYLRNLKKNVVNGSDKELGSGSIFRRLKITGFRVSFCIRLWIRVKLRLGAYVFFNFI